MPWSLYAFCQAVIQEVTSIKPLRRLWRFRLFFVNKDEIEFHVAIKGRVVEFVFISTSPIGQAKEFHLLTNITRSVLSIINPTFCRTDYWETSPPKVWKVYGSEVFMHFYCNTTLWVGERPLNDPYMELYILSMIIITPGCIDDIISSSGDAFVTHRTQALSKCHTSTCSYQPNQLACTMGNWQITSDSIVSKQT